MKNIKKFCSKHYKLIQFLNVNHFLSEKSFFKHFKFILTIVNSLINGNNFVNIG